jgi:hypothetical protein
MSRRKSPGLRYLGQTNPSLGMQGKGERKKGKEDIRKKKGKREKEREREKKRGKGKEGKEGKEAKEEEGKRKRKKGKRQKRQKRQNKKRRKMVTLKSSLGKRELDRNKQSLQNGGGGADQKGGRCWSGADGWLR